ncbi:MAG: VTT domain-containing protein [Gammaproteobacteria bacterium]|nr:MAG: VTT domain-containing protein [Gammaproteobacteria bacterium]
MQTRVARLTLFVLLAGTISLAIVYRDRFDAAALQAWVQDAGAWAPLLFMLIYAVAAVLFLPGSVLTLAGGALFGPLLGTVYNLTGATLGATLAFLVARYLASDWVAARSGGRLKQLINGVEAEGWRFVAFVRLVPLFPFNLLNYALGLTRIRFSHYLLATCVCMLPGAIAYTYLGYAGREAVGGGEGLIQKALLALALLAVVAFLPRLIGRLREGPMLSITELKQRLDSGADALLLDVRTGADFVGEQGHIAGATNIALEELSARLEDISDYQERPVYIVCRTDKRSAKAALLLAERGFADVHVARGGMTDWIRNGYPVSRA